MLSKSFNFNFYKELYKDQRALTLGITQPSREALLKLIKIIVEDYLCDDEYLKFHFIRLSKYHKKWRENHHFSLTQAAKILGVSYSAINSWEKQIYTIDRKSYDKVKQHIDV